MKRFIWNATSLVLLIGCIVVILFLVLSWSSEYVVKYWTLHGDHTLYCKLGIVGLKTQPLVADSGTLFTIESVWRTPTDRYQAQLPGMALDMLGVKYGHFFTSMANEAWWISIPMWYCIAILGSVPACRIIFIMALDKKRGYCLICGYDLRATPVRCPECGAMPKMHDFKSYS